MVILVYETSRPRPRVVFLALNMQLPLPQKRNGVAWTAYSATTPTGTSTNCLPFFELQNVSSSDPKHCAHDPGERQLALVS